MNEHEKLENEIFCLKYELQTFASNINQGKLERWVKGFSSITIEDSHIKRYKLASALVKDKIVLDMASGSGYGTYMLAEEGKAKEVTAVDIDADAVKYAGIRNAHAAVTYLEGDATRFSKPGYFDVIVSFETIEHLPGIYDYLRNINDSLKQDGRFLVSTPVSSMDLNTSPSNIFHVQEWGFQRFQDEVSKYLNIEKIYIQVYPYSKRSIFRRVLDKLLNIQAGPNLSVLEEYDKEKHRDLIKYLGSKTFGYQILVCSKKSIEQ